MTWILCVLSRLNPNPPAVLAAAAVSLARTSTNRRSARHGAARGFERGFSFKTTTLQGGIVKVKPGLTPVSGVVTGTTLRGRRMELMSSGFAESVSTVAYDASEVTPLISMGSDFGVNSGFTRLLMI